MGIADARYDLPLGTVAPLYLLKQCIAKQSVRGSRLEKLLSKEYLLWVLRLGFDVFGMSGSTRTRNTKENFKLIQRVAAGSALQRAEVSG